MMKHTPGTWVRCGFNVFSNETNRGVAKCQPDDGVGIYREISEETCIANADLIAAAPELLEACEYTIERLKAVKGKTFPIMPILNAIAKAKGEEVK
jgi:hypothetical protein